MDGGSGARFQGVHCAPLCTAVMAELDAAPDVTHGLVRGGHGEFGEGGGAWRGRNEGEGYCAMVLRSVSCRRVAGVCRKGRVRASDKL